MKYGKYSISHLSSLFMLRSGQSRWRVSLRVVSFAQKENDSSEGHDPIMQMLSHTRVRTNKEKSLSRSDC